MDEPSLRRTSFVELAVRRLTCSGFTRRSVQRAASNVDDPVLSRIRAHGTIVGAPAFCSSAFDTRSSTSATSSARSLTRSCCADRRCSNPPISSSGPGSCCWCGQSRLRGAGNRFRRPKSSIQPPVNRFLAGESALSSSRTPLHRLEASSNPRTTDFGLPQQEPIREQSTSTGAHRAPAVGKSTATDAERDPTKKKSSFH